MPSPTYVALAKTVLTGSQTTITFSAIPGTYTDLLLSTSARTIAGGKEENLLIQVNSITTTYSRTYIRGWGGTPATESGNITDYSSFLISSGVNGSTSTSNTFSNVEVYIPNYAGSTNKVASATAVVEGNLATTYPITAIAALLRNTAAITSLTITCNAGDFASGSRFDLYGIKNS